MPVKSQRYYATRSFGYAGKTLDRGQIIELAGVQNDEKLVRLGYFEEWNGKPSDEVECPEGGEHFIDRRTFEAHYEKRHVVRRESDPYIEDEQEEREERMLAEVAPLKVENAAGRKAA